MFWFDKIVEIDFRTTSRDFVIVPEWLSIVEQKAMLVFHEVDACFAPAYLETDTDKNILFYERFGFQVVGESKIFDVNNRYMWRNQVS